MAKASRALAVALILLLPAPLPAATLKIATLSPDGTSWMRSMRAAGKEISKRSDGRVKLRFYPGGVMGNDKSVMRKIRVGQLQGGAVTPGALDAVDKDLQVYSIPFLFRDLKEVDHVRRKMDARLMKDLEGKGFVGFGFAEGGFAYMMSRQPVKTVNDLKARKVWSPEGDRIVLTALESLGIAPVSLPIPDVLTALQTGLVDTIASPAVAAIALQWHTKVKYLTEVPLLYTYGLLVISDKAFGKLSEEDQELVREVLNRTFKSHRQPEPQGQRTGPCGAEKAGHRLRRATAQRSRALAAGPWTPRCSASNARVLLQGCGRTGTQAALRTTAGASTDRP